VSTGNPGQVFFNRAEFIESFVTVATLEFIYRHFGSPSDTNLQINLKKADKKDRRWHPIIIREASQIPGK